MTPFTLDPARTPAPAVRLDAFILPEAARAPFLARMEENLAFIRTLPGFQGHVVLEKQAGEGAFDLVTLATWDSPEALEAAGRAVRAHHQQRGLDLPGLLAGWGVQMVRADYGLAERA